MSQTSSAEPVSMPIGYVGTAVTAFTFGEVALAVLAACLVEVVFFSVLVSAGSNAHVKPTEEPEAKPIPIAVKPVLDDLPLLKLGGKKVRGKLPDMWQKQAPVRRYEAKSAPSPEASNSVDAIPTSEVAIGDAAAPPPDAELAAQVDETMQPDLDDPDAVTPTTPEGEGSPDGVREGTETDPMKARWVSEYQMRILSWFNSRFTPPSTGAPCEVLKSLTAAVSASIGPDRTVVGYVVTRPSGNATFDAKVRATMDAIVGQQLPPPPPLYPDILGQTVHPVFSGQKAQCSPASTPESPSEPPSSPPSP